VVALTLVMALLSSGSVLGANGKGQAKEKAKQERVAKYWTKARMANAVPRDFVKTDSGFKPVGRGNGKKPPKDDGGGGSGGATVTGESWPDNLRDLHRVTGKVFFTMGATNYVCSGAVVDDAGQSGSLVLTAGHCAWDEQRQNFASKWIFVRDYDSNPMDCSTAPSGCWVAVGLVVHDRYADETTFNADSIPFDWAFAVVPKDSPVGGFDLRTSDPVPRDLFSFGYPAAGQYSGSDLVYCSGPVVTDKSIPGTVGTHCDMTGGSSGGPMPATAESSAEVSSVNSYRYQGGKKKKYLFGPEFTGATEDTYTCALEAKPLTNTRVTSNPRNCSP
jgi:hypothetical protein